MMFTRFQKLSISIISVLCVLISVFGILNKQSYNMITTDVSSFDNAILTDYVSFEEEENNYSENIDVESLNYQLQDADTIFVATITDVANQYECLKYQINIDRIIKGKNIYSDDVAVLYEYSNFILNENNELTYFQTITKNLPLQKGKQYLVFAEAIEYERDYQGTLDYREFRIFDAEINTFCLTDNQKKALNSKAKYYKEFKNSEYICFSQKAIDNLNEIKKQIIDIYLNKI